MSFNTKGESPPATPLFAAMLHSDSKNNGVLVTLYGIRQEVLWLC